MGKVIKSFRNDFTMTHNAVIDDKRLHLKSLGLFLYLWRQPDDWKFYLKEIATNHKDGIDGTRVALEELEKYGYLVRVPKRDKDTGRYDNSDWILTDEPDLNTNKSATQPALENPTLENPMQENPTLLSTRSTKDLLTKGNNNGAPKSPNAFELYEGVTGKYLNSYQSAIFIDHIEQLGKKLVEHAIKFAKSQNSPNFGFINSVLNEWENSRTDENKISVVDVASANAYQAVRQRKVEQQVQANHYKATKSVKKEGKEDGAVWS